jgi:hypothetical protein
MYKGTDEQTDDGMAGETVGQTAKQTDGQIFGQNRRR